MITLVLLILLAAAPANACDTKEFFASYKAWQDIKTTPARPAAPGDPRCGFLAVNTPACLRLQADRLEAEEKRLIVEKQAQARFEKAGEACK